MVRVGGEVCRAKAGGPGRPPDRRSGYVTYLTAHTRSPTGAARRKEPLRVGVPGAEPEAEPGPRPEWLCNRSVRSNRATGVTGAAARPERPERLRDRNDRSNCATGTTGATA